MDLLARSDTVEDYSISYHLKLYMSEDGIEKACVVIFVPVFAALRKAVKTPPKPQARGVVFEEVVSSDLDDNELLSELKPKISLSRKNK